MRTLKGEGVALWDVIEPMILVESLCPRCRGLFCVLETYGEKRTGKSRSKRDLKRNI